MQKMQFLVLVNVSFLGNCFQAGLLTKTKSKLTLAFEIAWQFPLSYFKVCMGGLMGLVNAFSVVTPVARGLMLGSVAWTWRGFQGRANLCQRPNSQENQAVPINSSVCLSLLPWASVSSTRGGVAQIPQQGDCRGFIFALPASAPSVFPIGDLQLYGCLQRIPWQPAVKHQPGKHTLDGGMIPSFWNCCWV